MVKKKSGDGVDKNVWQVYTSLVSEGPPEPRDLVSYEILHVAMAYQELHDVSQYYRTDVVIHDSEIHLVGTVIKNPGIHITGLAKCLGVTKGAVSEMVAKLVKKGLLTKNPSPRNLSVVEVAATPNGRTAHEAHLYFHEMIDGMVKKELAGASEAQVKIIYDFLKTMTSKFKQLKNLL